MKNGTYRRLRKVRGPVRMDMVRNLDMVMGKLSGK